MTKQIPLFHRILNLFYRITAPNNPRGWIQVYIEADANFPDKRHIFTEGMAKWNLPDIEFVEVPDDLAGRTHGILFEIINYLKNYTNIKFGETFGLQTETLTVAGKIIQGSEGRNRVVDVDFPVNAESNFFPAKMFHTLLITEVMRSNSSLPVDEELTLLKRAIELFPGDIKHPITNEKEASENFSRNGATAFQLIADAYAEKQESEECTKALDKFFQLSPYDAKEYGKAIAKAAQEGSLPIDDVRSQYWIKKYEAGELN